MENNSSPYIYEKPLRNKRSIRNRAIAAVGLVALGSAIGGGAFANSVIGGATAVPSENLETTETAEVFQNSATAGEPGLGNTNATFPGETMISIPFEQAKPVAGTAALELPSLSGTNFGNTSSATPYASGGQTGSNLSSYQTRDRDDDRYEDHSKTQDQDDREDDHEDENEENED